MKQFFDKRQFNRKVIVSGNVIECYEYERPVISGKSVKRIGRANAQFTAETTEEENRKKTAQRAKTKVKRTANANPQLNKFLTLTFAENVTDISYAHKELDRFFKRLKYHYKDFQYISVVEFQKRGAVHFHLLCNLPYVEVDTLAKIWKNGFVKINKIDSVDNVGAYITKYMTKENVDERLKEKKCYTMSKGLNEPKEYTKEEEVEEVLSSIEQVKRVYTSEFETEHYGVVRYTQIVCLEPPRYSKKRGRLFFGKKPRLMLCPDTLRCPAF